MKIEFRFLTTSNDSNVAYFECYIKNKKFSGFSEFGMYYEYVKKLENSLERMHKELNGSCTVTDIDSDSFVFLEMEKYGKMTIKGQLGGSHEDNYLNFGIESDQTIIPKIINELNEFLINIGQS